MQAQPAQHAHQDSGSQKAVCYCVWDTNLSRVAYSADRLMLIGVGLGKAHTDVDHLLPAVAHMGCQGELLAEWMRRCLQGVER